MGNKLQPHVKMTAHGTKSLHSKMFSGPKNCPKSAHTTSDRKNSTDLGHRKFIQKLLNRSETYCQSIWNLVSIDSRLRINRSEAS